MTKQFGASFSAKYCRELGVDPKQCLKAALSDLGVRHLRLMSYWDVHETVPNVFDFTELDWQFAMAEKYGAKVSLCLGVRQPRWPESHWPAWALNMPGSEWQALQYFIKTVVRRYRKRPCLISWQLENEALLRHFGQNGNFDRKRLKAEFKLVKRLDKRHPVIMTTSDSWGMPFFGPRPDLYGFSIYRYFHDRGQYRRSRRLPIFFAVRASLIRLFKRRPVFIHELQAEPWGPVATVRMPISEQLDTMDMARVREAIVFARATKLLPADVWGLEWWYYLRQTHQRTEIWDYMRTIFTGDEA